LFLDQENWYEFNHVSSLIKEIEDKILRNLFEINMKKLLRKLFGIEEMEEAIAETIQRQIAAQQALKAVEEEKNRLLEIAIKELAEVEDAKRLSKLTPKELATERKEPYVAVLNTYVNKDNLRNGFFELDWNEYFVMQLTEVGYKGASEEEIVDAWFSELCRNIGAESGVDMERRGSGYVNRALRDDGKTEIS
jgi:vacuolar-type H+-ATPase subunit I/STV1